MSRKHTVVAAIAMGLVLASGPAWAQDASALITGQALFDQARALVKQGKFDEACPKFAQSQQLAPAVGTLLNLGDCFENSGRTASAWASFREAATLASNTGQEERADYGRKRQAKLEPKLSRITIDVTIASEPAGLEVRRDGRVLARPEWGVPIPVDPGPRRIEASAPGRKGWSTTVDIVSGERTSVTIPLLEPAPVDAPVAPPVAHANVERPPPSTGGTQRLAGIAVAGVGVVGLIVGTTAGLVAKSKNDDALTHCDAGFCDAEGLSLTSSAQSAAAISTIGFVLGGAALAGGAVLYLTAPRSTARAATAPGSVAVRTAATPGGGRMEVGMTW